MSVELETLGIETYEIGAKIRRLRKKKDLSLMKLGEHTGTSAGLLSKIETGRLIPTLPTLMRIATVFGVGLDHFFENESEQPKAALVRAKDRVRLPNRTDGHAPTYWFECLDFPVTNRRMDAYLATFKPGARATEPHKHAGAEVIYVIAGSLLVTFENETILLDKGDSTYFDATFPHSYRQQGKAACCAVVVVTNG